MIFAASLLPLLLLLHPQPITGNNNDRRAELLESFAAAAKAHTKAGTDHSAGTINTANKNPNSATTRHGRAAMLDSTARSSIPRQLQGLSVTEFCSNLDAIELYTTDRFMTVIPGIPFLTEDEQYVCSCLIQGEFLDLMCGAFYEVDSFNPPIANIDYMQLQMGADETSYTAISVGWCEYYEGSYEGATYCEDYVLDSEDSSKFASCSVRDDTCRVADAPECEVCEGGQSVSIFSNENCYNTSIVCEDNYMGAWLYEYHVASPIQVMADGPVGCVGDAPAADEWCADLSGVEMAITEAFRGYLPDLELTPYECNCVGGDNSTLALTCANSYFEGLSNTTYRGTEVMIFSEQNGYLIPNQMQWCGFNINDSTDFYCESFDFAFLQNELSFCEFGDCGSGFCELCSDGLSVANTCDANVTCGESIPGAFLFAYKDTKLAAELCSVPPPPTEVPVGAPTPAPVSVPTPAPVGTTPTTPTPVDDLTPAPVDSPTMAPEEEPTPAPEEDPTPAPVEDPTPAPSEESKGFSLHCFASVVSASFAIAAVFIGS